MSILAFDEETGRVVEGDALALTNKLMKAKKERKPWEVVDMIVDAFRKKYPKRYKSYVIRLEEVRDSQKVTGVGKSYFRGVSRDSKNDAYLAHTVDFPAWIMNLIRKVYDTDELIMDKDFFREFGQRYPEFRVMEKV